MKKSLTLLVDMDDTIELLTDAWVDWLNEKHGTDTVKDDIHSWDFAAAFPTLTDDEAYAPIYIDEFWDTVQPMPWAFETLCRLRAEGHEIYVVTSSAYQTIPAKMEKVLFRYFPFLDWEHVIVTGNKSMIRGDVLIDDGPHNLEEFDGARLLMTAPHNRDYDAESHGMIRVSDWPEIFELLREFARIKG